MAAAGALKWQSVDDNVVVYQFSPLAAASPGKSNENAICQQGDTIKNNILSEDNHNSQLILLSINFDKPLGV